MSAENGRGFTLVELMVVIAVIAIMATVATPALLGSLPGLRVNGAARQVLTDLRYTRTLAVEKGANAYFDLDAGGTYTLGVDLNDDGDILDTGETVSTVDLDGATYGYRDITFGTNYTVPASPPEVVAIGVGTQIQFQPRGSADTSGSIYLMPNKDAGTRDDRNRRVVLSAATGNIRIEKWDGTTWE